MELEIVGKGDCGFVRGLGLMLLRRGSSRLLVKRGLVGLLAGCSLGGRGSGLEPWKAGSRVTELSSGAG